MLLLQLAAMICVHDELSITYTSLSEGQVLVFIHDHPRPRMRMSLTAFARE